MNMESEMSDEEMWLSPANFDGKGRSLSAGVYRHLVEEQEKELWNWMQVNRYGFAGNNEPIKIEPIEESHFRRAIKQMEDNVPSMIIYKANEMETMLEKLKAEENLKAIYEQTGKRTGITDGFGNILMQYPPENNEKHDSKI